ncbi:phosphorelay protein LuxU [Vibrio ponticus]|nr:phosphorelay protein LuxU [Vibrio ponticus]
MDIINHQQVERLKQEIGADNLPVLLGIFLTELNQYAEKLNLPDNDQDSYLKEISHALKSSAASFGAEALRSLAIDYDSAGKSGLMLASPEHKQKMLNLLQITHQQYEILLAE